MDSDSNCPLRPAPKKYPDPDTLDCFFCWEFNKNHPRDKIVLKNAKYCQLYPKNKLKELNAVEPKFEQSKTLYTQCDYMLEECAHKIILKVEEALKSHSNMVEEEMKLQNELLKDMWTNSQRYLILNRGGVCFKLYPEIISKPTEERALCAFHRNLRQVIESNERMAKSLGEIRNLLADLEKACSKLDYTVDSPFISGAYYLKSLKYIRGIIDDMYQYFYDHLCKLKRWADLLDPGDSVAIEDYMNLIRPNEPHQNCLVEYNTECSCMRSKRKNCIDETVPC